MFRNYLLLALRNLTRQKAFSFINIAGLAVGLASSLIILLWVKDEKSYDASHSKADRTYRLLAAASDLEVAISPAPVVPALQQISSEISHTTRLSKSSGVMLEVGGKKFEEKKAFYAEPSFFDVFDFGLAAGDPATALSEPNSVILSEELAVKYFGTTDAVGKTLIKGGRENFMVTGVLAKPTFNSHLQFDLLLPWSYIATRDYNIKNNVWGNFDFYSYIVFDTPKNQSFLKQFESKIDTLFAEHDKQVKVAFTLQPLGDIHLHSHLMGDLPGHGNAQYVDAFSIIAIFITLIACINFMNLSTARAARRAKEVGLRKVAGAVRWQLIKQFVGESLAITGISLVVALIAVTLLLPAVNNLVGKAMVISWSDPFTIGTVLTVALATGILSGVYPAFVLSAFKPVKVLKNDLKTSGAGSAFRNALVVVQFVISIVLLTGTAIVYQQLRFVQSKDIGFNKENLLYMTLHGDVKDKINKYRTALEANPATANVTIANGLPTNHVSGAADVKWQGKDPAAQIMFAMLTIDEKFLPVYDIDLASGRNYYQDLLGDSGNFLINQTAAKIMGFTEESAVGQQLDLWGNKGVIVGVVKDFNFKPLQEPIEPLLMRANIWGGTIVVKAGDGKIDETILGMQQVWSSLEPVYPFTYNFVDQDIENMYRSEQQIGTLFTFFAVLAIVISCLGLYGLSAYIAEQRTREIGIRKALGASITHIMYLLNTRFALPVITAIILAGPLSYYVMNQWLSGFAYRIDFNWLTVVVAGGVAFFVSLFTVSYETIKAARMNPIKSLRDL